MLWKHRIKVFEFGTLDPTDINQNWHFHISLICEAEYQSEAGRLLQAGSSFRSSSRSLSFSLSNIIIIITLIEIQLKIS